MCGNNQYCHNVLPETRFWKLVDIKGEDDCWEWLGCKSKKGYGRFVLSAVGNKQKFISSHRFSYLSKNKTIGDGLLVCHKCNNPGCVNPNHLYAGTNLDNMRDAVLAGSFRNRVYPVGRKATQEQRNKMSNAQRDARKRQGMYKPPPIRYGEDNNRAKLNCDLVRSIRSMHHNDGLSSYRIAKIIGVSKRTILSVVNCKTWRHVL